MNFVETFVRHGFWVVLALWAILLAPAVWRTHFRVKKELDGLVIPARHLPPKRHGR